jgi:hypothetical protein
VLAVGELLQPTELLGEHRVLGTLPGLHRLEGHGLLDEDLTKSLPTDRLEDPLLDQALSEEVERPAGGTVPPVVLRSREGKLNDDPTNGWGELRLGPGILLRVEGVPPHAIVVLDDLTDPGLAPEDHRGDLGRREPLVGVEHHHHALGDRGVMGALDQSAEGRTFLVRRRANAQHRRRVISSPRKVLALEVRNLELLH